MDWKEAKENSISITIGKIHVFQTPIFSIPRRKGIRSFDQKYKKWQQAVLERDNYQCVICGAEQNLVADHIRSWWTNPTLRYKVSNGRTLCRSCHAKFGAKQPMLIPHILSEEEKERKPSIPLPMPGLGWDKEIVKISKRGSSFTIPLPSLWIASGYIKDGDLITFVWTEEIPAVLFGLPPVVFPFKLNSEQDLTSEVLERLHHILAEKKSHLEQFYFEETKQDKPRPLYLMLPLFDQRNG